MITCRALRHAQRAAAVAGVAGEPRGVALHDGVRRHVGRHDGARRRPSPSAPIVTPGRTTAPAPIDAPWRDERRLDGPVVVGLQRAVGVDGARVAVVGEDGVRADEDAVLERDAVEDRRAVLDLAAVADDDVRDRRTRPCRGCTRARCARPRAPARGARCACPRRSSRLGRDSAVGWMRVGMQFSELCRLLRATDAVAGLTASSLRAPRPSARRRGRRRRPAAASPDGRGRRAAARMRSASAPASTFQPPSSVSDHSVSSRSVTQGTPSRYASFCTPPESVSTMRALLLERQHVEVADRLDDAHGRLRPRCPCPSARPACAGAAAGSRARAAAPARRRSRRAARGRRCSPRGAPSRAT